MQFINIHTHASSGNSDVLEIVNQYPNSFDDKVDLIDAYKIPVKSLHILGGIGVDLNKFKYIKPILSNNITFLFIGRLVEAKGIFEFIPVF